MRWVLPFSLFVLISCSLFAQSDTGIVTVEDVFFVGNKKTKDRIIERELDILAGDTISIKNMSERITQNEKRILNTGLFNKVDINIKNWNTDRALIIFEITVIENWYIYPAPIFELADRNFNVWWSEMNRDLSRVNYGMRASHINLTGNRDKLKLVTQFGYTRKYELEYNYPYVNDEQTLGLAGNIFYSENKEIGYITEGNKTLFYQDPSEDVLLRRFRIGAWSDYRSGLFSFHRLKLEFHQNSVAEVVAAELNSDYFLNGADQLRFFKLEYNYQYDKRIFNLYPSGGYSLVANLQKEGLGIFGEYDNLGMSVEVQKYFKIHNRLILATRAKAKTNLTRQRQAFANNTGLGYGDDLVSGYDLYVIDGTDFLLSQNVARYKIFDRLLNFGKAMPINAFKVLSLQVFVNFNFDVGYVNDRHYADDPTLNTLNNRFIYGYGPGIDFILYNNFLFQIEYNFNQLGENGLFLHNTISF